MVLVDTSVWIDFLHRGNARFESLLEQDYVLIHPFVIGELACGHIQARASTLRRLQQLPKANCARDEEVLHLIEGNQLYGKGLGFTDAHIIAAGIISDCMVWTRDRRFRDVLEMLELAYTVD